MYSYVLYNQISKCKKLRQLEASQFYMNAISQNQRDLVEEHKAGWENSNKESAVFVGMRDTRQGLEMIQSYGQEIRSKMLKTKTAQQKTYN